MLATIKSDRPVIVPGEWDRLYQTREIPSRRAEPRSAFRRRPVGYSDGRIPLSHNNFTPSPDYSRECPNMAYFRTEYAIVRISTNESPTK